MSIIKSIPIDHFIPLPLWILFRFSQNTLKVRRQHILPHGSHHRLQRLVRLTLGIIVLHILQRGKRRLDAEIVPLVARIGERRPRGRADDIWLSVLNHVQCVSMLIPFPSTQGKWSGISDVTRGLMLGAWAKYEYSP